MSDNWIQSILRFMCREQDMVLKVKIAKKITKCYCLIIMEFIDVNIEVP